MTKIGDFFIRNEEPKKRCKPLISKDTAFCFFDISTGFLFYLIQNTAYKGIDFILFSSPKFLVENRIAYLGLYLLIYIFKLADFTLFPLLTSIGSIPSSSLYNRKSISALLFDVQ